MAQAVQPERILKDLAKVWVDLGKDQSTKGSGGVLRACSMTMIAAVEEEADAQSVSEAIAEIMHQHPSRMIVMRVVNDAEDSLSARVFAQCWMPFGRRQQICCEEIEITASSGRVDDLPKLVLGLMAPDLPVVLWCRSERLARDAAFQNLFPLTHKIVIDSSSFAVPSEALRFLRENNQAGRNIADLAWTRLTDLRSTVSQIFDNEAARRQIHRLGQVTISYAGPSSDTANAPTSAQYLSAWFKGASPARVELAFRHEQAQEEILGVSMDGPELHVSVELEDATASVYVNGLTRRISLPPRNDAGLMREELSILGPDPIYRRCLG